MDKLGAILGVPKSTGPAGPMPGELAVDDLDLPAEDILKACANNDTALLKAGLRAAFAVLQSSPEPEME